jgi:hypothetical protein
VGNSVTNHLIYVRLATLYRSPSHRQGSRVTERAMLSQGAKRSSREPSLAVARPGTRRGDVFLAGKLAETVCQSLENGWKIL